jgi:hypothetical protein
MQKSSHLTQHARHLPTLKVPQYLQLSNPAVITAEPDLAPKPSSLLVCLEWSVQSLIPINSSVVKDSPLFAQLASLLTLVYAPIL